MAWNYDVFKNAETGQACLINPEVIAYCYAVTHKTDPNAPANAKTAIILRGGENVPGFYAEDTFEQLAYRFAGYGEGMASVLHS